MEQLSEKNIQRELLDFLCSLENTRMVRDRPSFIDYIGLSRLKTQIDWEDDQLTFSDRLIRQLAENSKGSLQELLSALAAAHLYLGIERQEQLGQLAAAIDALTPEQWERAFSKSPVNLVAAEEVYRQKVIDSYKVLNFSGFDKSDLSFARVPLALEDIFVRLTLSVEKVIREPMPPTSPMQAEEAERSNRRSKSSPRERVIITQQPIELSQALADHLLIVGEPGAGKSTLLRWLAVTFAKGQQREPDRLGPLADPDRLPVLVELGHLPQRYLSPEGGEESNWMQLLLDYFVSQEAFNSIPLQLLKQLLRQALEDGRCLFLFDGLDEVADRHVRAHLAGSLAKFARAFHHDNRMIIGSRPAGVSESEGALRPQFQRCQIERFTPEDVRCFFHFWYAQDHEMTPEKQREDADALYARVQTTPAILQLATTPLLSTILVLIWRNNNNLPERRVDLYEQCCRILIENWERHHEVRYLGTLTKLDWEDHLRLLTPLAYIIHSQEQRTSATRDELAPRLTQVLQENPQYANNANVANWEARQFLNALSLRSGLLQYIGDGTYSFPHQTFQEYLVARYIAEQPEYIDLVMAHLHEVWWQEVHLLTIAHLGSGRAGASKASALILAILRVYAPPTWILLPSRSTFLRWIGPGKLLPQVYLAERIAWMLDREFELAARSYTECASNGTTKKVDKVLTARAVSILKYLIFRERSLRGIFYRGTLYRENNYEIQNSLLPITFQFLQRQGNETVVKDLLKTLHAASVGQRVRIVAILGQIGASNEKVVEALRETLLKDEGEMVRVQAAISLVQIGIDSETALKVLLEPLDHDRDVYGTVRKQVAASLGQVGAGNEKAVEALREMLLKDESLGVREQAAASLGQIGVGNELAVKALLGTLRTDEDVRVREQAAIGLGRVGVGNEVVVEVLLETLLKGDEDERVHEQAAISLGQMGANNKAVMEILLTNQLETLLKSKDDRQRRYVARKMGQIGAGNEKAVEALLEMVLMDEDSLVRGNAAESLGQVGAGKEKVVDALVEALLTDEDDGVRNRSTESLGQVGAGNETVIKALLKALNHDADEGVREQAAESLGQLGIRDTTQLRSVLVALNRHLYDTDDSAGYAALVSMRRLLDGQPIPGYQWRSRRGWWVRRLLKRVVSWSVLLTIVVAMLASVAIMDFALNWWLHIPSRASLLIILAGIISVIFAVFVIYKDLIKDELPYPKTFVSSIIVGATIALSTWLSDADGSALPTGFWIVLAIFAVFIVIAFIAIVYRHRNRSERLKAALRRRRIQATQGQQLDPAQLEAAVNKRLEQYYLGVLTMSEQTLGTEHSITASCLNTLALLYYSQQKYEQAEPLLKRILTIQEQVLGPDHLDIAVSLNYLARLYHLQGKYTEAEPFYLWALAIREQRLGTMHPDTAVSLNNLAALYSNQGKYAEAEPLYLQALQIRGQTLGPEHPFTGTTLHLLGDLYWAWGKYEQAEPSYQRALAISEQAEGPEHPSTATTLHSLAALYQHMGKYEQAEPLCLRALAISEQSEGPEHLSTGMTLHLLAALYRHMGKYEQAEPLYLRALAISEQQLGTMHPSTALVLDGLAECHGEQEKYAEALPLLKRVALIWEQELGQEHSTTQTAFENYALLSQAMEHDVEAEPSEEEH